MPDFRDITEVKKGSPRGLFNMGVKRTTSTVGTLSRPDPHDPRTPEKSPKVNPWLAYKSSQVKRIYLFLVRTEALRVGLRLKSLYFSMAKKVKNCSRRVAACGPSSGLILAILAHLTNQCNTA